MTAWTWTIWKYDTKQERWVRTFAGNAKELAYLMFTAEGGSRQLKQNGHIRAWSGPFADPDIDPTLEVPDYLPED